MPTAPHVEYRILMTGAEKATYSANFAAITDMEACKQKVLARLREEAAERKRR